MEPIQIRLSLPLELGAAVVAKPAIQSAVAKGGMKVASVATPREASGTFRDFGATVVVVLGTAAAAAAVKGIFDVIKTVVQEAYKTHRQKQAHQQARNMLLLTLGAKSVEFDLEDSLENIEAALGALEREIG